MGKWWPVCIDTTPSAAGLDPHFLQMTASVQSVPFMKRKIHDNSKHFKDSEHHNSKENTKVEQVKERQSIYKSMSIKYIKMSNFNIE